MTSNLLSFFLMASSEMTYTRHFAPNLGILKFDVETKIERQISHLA